MMEICKLSDIAKFTTGKLNSNAAEAGGNYPFFTCSPEPLRINTYAFNTEAIILAGNNAEGNFHIQYYEGKFNAYQRTYVIESCDASRVNLRYLYYALKMCLHHFKQISQGTATKFLTAKILNGFELPIPTIEKQNKIASLLGSLDKKIESNEIINKNLEQQAQGIFKEWFIDNPENNEWPTGTFSELIKSTLNGDWGKAAPTGNNTEKVYCIRGADIPEVKAGNKGKMPTRYILPKNFATKQLTAGDIVVEISGGSPTQSTGRCTAITQSLLDRYDSGMVCTNFCKAMKPKEGYSLFIYYYWQYLYDKGVFFSYENGTTGIKNLDFPGFIETEPILIPPVDKVIAFDDYCKSIFNQIFANGKQNEHLAVLRDTLLPKLMSGELDVSNIDL